MSETESMAGGLSGLTQERDLRGSDLLRIFGDRVCRVVLVVRDGDRECRTEIDIGSSLDGVSHPDILQSPLQSDPKGDAA